MHTFPEANPASERKEALSLLTYKIYRAPTSRKFKSSLNSAWFFGYPCFHEISLSRTPKSTSQSVLGSAQQLEQQEHEKVESTAQESLVKMSMSLGFRAQTGSALPVSILLSRRSISAEWNKMSGKKMDVTGIHSKCTKQSNDQVSTY